MAGVQLPHKVQLSDMWGSQTPQQSNWVRHSRKAKLLGSTACGNVGASLQQPHEKASYCNSPINICADWPIHLALPLQSVGVSDLSIALLA